MHRPPGVPTGGGGLPNPCLTFLTSFLCLLQGNRTYNHSRVSKKHRDMDTRRALLELPTPYLSLLVILAGPLVPVSQAAPGSP